MLMKTQRPYILLILFSFMLCQCIVAEEEAQKTSLEEIATEDNMASSTEVSATSDITCPHCGFTKTEPLPTEYCKIKYTCTSCGQELTPKDGDCCVFCTHGTHKCPSMQEED